VNDEIKTHSVCLVSPLGMLPPKPVGLCCWCGVRQARWWQRAEGKLELYQALCLGCVRRNAVWPTFTGRAGPGRE